MPITAVKLSQRQDMLAEPSVLYDLANSQQAIETFHAALRRLRGEAVVFRLCVTNLHEAYAEFSKGTEERLKAMFSAPDILIRLDEENFLVAVMGLDITASENVGDNIKRVLTDLPYQTAFGHLSTRIDINAAELLGRDLLDIEALYQTLGLSIVSDSLPHALQHCQAAQTWNVETIISMLNERRLDMAYQPIIEVSSGRVHHYEALMRIVEDDGTRVSAGNMIMAAETHELAHLLDHRALELAAQMLRQHKQVKLAVNISADTLKTKERANAYLKALRALGPDTRRLTLELTETAALEDLAIACMFSERARSFGCEFAIDDFGVGHTSFKNLMAIEADTIKIDRSFVDGIGDDTHKQAFVRMITDLAQIFAIETVAEGIETQADADCLKALGVHYFQGYLFGKPQADLHTPSP